MASEQDFPLISIIIPVYNRKHLIPDAVNSALAQTYPNTEVVVVDDASDDGTWEILQGIASSFTLLRQTRNRGQSAARNRGLFACQGEYVQFLDSDDVLEPDAVENLWTALRPLEKRDPGWGISYGKRLTCDARLNPVRTRPKQHHTGHILPRLLTDNFIHTGTYLARKSVLKEVGGFKEDLAAKEDLLLHLFIAARYRFLFVNRFVCRYRRHDGVRARNNIPKILGQGTRHLDYFFARYPDPEIGEARNRAYADEHLNLGKMAWRSGRSAQYLIHWQAMCRYRPFLRFHPKYLFRALVSAHRSGCQGG